MLLDSEKGRVHMASKVKGKQIASFNGFKIYKRFTKAKRQGMDRIWIGIRQDGNKKWRTAATLSYVHALDVRFEK